ncbi:unnamed protein product [Paramecium pentaurelia]|uniref:Uncharacterized protein n=1 Tax=Paramecium pentaurelia TaxID=43138 RepID=A0A8S1RZF0_9CILI|nr:unnamed protein product [Paramecium pentaurelia]
MQMHLRIKSDIIYEQINLDLQQSSSQRFLKSEQKSQSLSSQIYEGMLSERKIDSQFSPKIKRNQQRHQLNSSYCWFYEDDQEQEEHSIWGDSGQLPVGNNKENKLISFLELYKYRYERTTKKPISSYNVIQMAKKLINRHSNSRIKYLGINKLQWIDFRDWSK